MRLRNSQIASIKRYLLKQNHRNYCLFTFGLYSGLKPAHLINLNVSDVLDENGHSREIIKVKYRNDYLTITFCKPAKDFIRKYYKLFLKDNFDVNQPLFPSRKGGKAISRYQTHRILSNAAKAVGVTFNFSTYHLYINYLLKMYWLDKDDPDRKRYSKIVYPEVLRRRIPEELWEYYELIPRD